MEPSLGPSQVQVEDVDKLDEEFRTILRFIKEQIPFITSNYHLTQYRLWLEKLSGSNMEKMERNMYLMELARQIQSNNLLPPFHQAPPQGSLKNLPKINHFCPSAVELNSTNNDDVWPWDDPTSLICDDPLSFPQEFVQSLQSLECSKQFNISPPNRIVSHQNQPTDNLLLDPISSSSSLRAVKMELKANKTLGKRKKQLPKLKSSTHKMCVDDFTDNFHFKSSILKDYHSRHIHRCKEQHNLPKLEDKILRDDGSWCDLTDASQPSATSIGPLGSGDTEKTSNKEDIVQQNVINDFMNNTETFHHESGDKEQVSPETPMEFTSNRLETVDEELPEEIILEADSTYKVLLKDTNYIPTDLKKTVESLQIRLTETLNQNNELKSIIDALQLKLEEQHSNFQHEMERQHRNSMEQKSKEIEELKLNQAQSLLMIEENFKNKIREAEKTFQQNLDRAKSCYDFKINEAKKEHSHLLKDKEKEVERLTNIIHQQCLRMASEISELRKQISKSASAKKISEEKIIVLKRCITKMDKLFQKSEMEYLSNIEKLKQEINVKEKASQIQLQAQRAELISKVSLEKKEEVESIINNLEVKYVQMLEKHELHMAESRQKDEETIEKLKKILDTHGISYTLK